MITGGAASGKSRWAVTYFKACDNVLYWSVSDNMDADTMKRIDYDCKANDVEWVIKTGFCDDPVEQITGHKFVVMDSTASYTSAVIKSMCPDISKMDEPLKKEIERKVIDDITAMYDKIDDCEGNIIVITLETGFSITPADRSQLLFREILGNVNQRIGNISDEVYLSASGIQFRIK